MDSTLLDQIRYLCRDRAAYEHLKAILVQQERVHQLNWEARYTQLMSSQSSDQSSDTQASDLFSNIIAREKALAQLADAIQRSPSLELVLQVAVQVAQKLLQVDRVAIFRCYPDGRGEFVTDAIAAGVQSIADMPERQLSLARHMIESTDTEHLTQTVDSIRSSSLSSHIVTLLEQIGISSYAANKIYAGQEVWGTLVAFHGSVYHSWSESDRTSLSLITAQIGIALSLTNLRQQSQSLSDDLQNLRTELDSLQQTVVKMSESATNSTVTDVTIIDDATVITPIDQVVIADAENENLISQNFEIQDLEPDALEASQVEQEQDHLVEPDDLVNQDELISQDLEPDALEASQVEQDLDEEESTLSGLVNHSEEIADLKYDPISQNGLPPLFLAPDSNASLSELTDEEIEIEMQEVAVAEVDIPNSDTSQQEVTGIEVPENIVPDVVEVEESDPENVEIQLDESQLDLVENLEIVEAEQEAIALETAETQIAEIQINDSSEQESNFLKLDDSEVITSESSQVQDPQLEESEVKLLTLEAIESSESDQNVLVLEAIEASKLAESSQNLIVLEAIESLELIEADQNMIVLGVVELDLADFAESEISAQESNDLESGEPETSELENPETEVVALDVELGEPQVTELENAPTPEISGSEVEQIDDLQVDESVTSDASLEEEEDPALELQFMETILEIAGYEKNAPKAIEFLLNVIDSYLEDAPHLVQMIDRSLASNDHIKLLQSLNTLRTSSDYIGALTLSYQCRQLESAVKANYVVLIYACLSRVAIEVQRATDALRIERSRYSQKL